MTGDFYKEHVVRARSLVHVAAVSIAALVLLALLDPLAAADRKFYDDDPIAVEPDPQDATMIKTVRSGGYMFTPRVEAIGVEAVTAAGN